MATTTAAPVAGGVSEGEVVGRREEEDCKEELTE